MLTTFELDDYIFEPLRAGASGFLLKDADPTELVHAVRVATGAANDEIADALTLSPATVRTHVGRAMVKLAARDRAQLVVYAIQSGLTDPASPGHDGTHG